MNNVEMNFYYIKDGIPSMKDSFIVSLLDRCEKDGTLEMFFFGDRKPDKQGFVRRIKYEPRLMFFTILYEGDIAGFGLVDNIRHRTGQGHFCVFSEYWGHEASISATKEVYRRLLEKQFTVLIGIIPKDNAFAIQFCEKTGMKYLCDIPQHFNGIDGVQFCIEREV